MAPARGTSQSPAAVQPSAASEAACLSGLQAMHAQQVSSDHLNVHANVVGLRAAELEAAWCLHVHAVRSECPPAKGAADSISSPWNSRASLRQQDRTQLP
jgi:hypothetical protein